MSFVKKNWVALLIGLSLVVGTVIFYHQSLHFAQLAGGEGNDDAYISFRYAKNLAEGNGLVYNIGPPSETTI